MSIFCLKYYFSARKVFPSVFDSICEDLLFMAQFTLLHKRLAVTVFIRMATSYRTAICVIMKVTFLSGDLEFILLSLMKFNFSNMGGCEETTLTTYIRN